MLTTNIGPRIKRYRQALGLTQAALAQQAGTTRIHVANLEAPDHAPYHRRPSLAMVLRLAKALHVGIGVLVGEKPGRKKSNR